MKKNIPNLYVISTTNQATHTGGGFLTRQIKGLGRSSAITSALLMLVAMLAPLAVSHYFIRVLCLTIITYMCVLSLYVLFGMCGQSSFMQCGLWGVGAYITALLTTRLHVPPIIAMLGSMAGTGLFAFLIGLVLFRLKRYYYAFSTIGMMMVLNGLFLNWTAGTGGALGISDIPPFGIGPFQVRSGMANYYLILAFATGATVMVWMLYRSSLGRSFMAIRDNETAANCMGINSLITKDIAFALSGILCGAAGALFSFLSGYISSTSFILSTSQLYLVIIMLGGTSSPAGALVGSLIITLLPEWFRPLKDYMMLMYGMGIMGLMIVLPEGLIGGGKDLYDKFRSRRR